MNDKPVNRIVGQVTENDEGELVAVFDETDEKVVSFLDDLIEAGRQGKVSKLVDGKEAEASPQDVEKMVADLMDKHGPLEPEEAPPDVTYFAEVANVGINLNESVAIRFTTDTGKTVQVNFEDESVPGNMALTVIAMLTDEATIKDVEAVLTAHGVGKKE